MQAPGTPAVSKPRHGLAAIVLTVAALAAFGNSFDGGFAQDAKYLIPGDQRVHAVNAKNLGLIFSQTAQVALTATPLYRPVNTLSYLFNYAVLNNGDRPFGYHAVNLLFHIGNAFLVYLLALALMGEFIPALFTAALWAVHPVATEGVTNLVGRADQMAAMGVLGALVLYIYGTQPGIAHQRRWLFGSVAVFAAGMFSKENAVVLPALIVLYDITFRFHPVKRAGDWIRQAIEFAKVRWWVFAIPVLLFLYARHLVLADSPPGLLGYIENPILGAPFLSAELTAVKVLGMYLWMLVWPADLSCDYSYNQIPIAGLDDWQALAALAVLGGLAFIAIRGFRRKPVFFFLIAWCAVTILPVSNLIIRIGTIMGVRFLYLPSVGFTCGLVMAVYGLAQRMKWNQRTVMAILCAIGAMYTTRTISRNRDWKDDLTLYSSALPVSPNSTKVHFTQSFFLAQKKPLADYIDQALAETELGLDIIKDVPDKYNAAALLTEAAQRYGSKAEIIDPGSAEGQRLPTPEAMVWYRKAIEVLHHAVAVDRAVSNQFREADLARGRREEDLPQFGNEGTYWQLGNYQLRVGDGKGAVDSYLYERRFNPLKLEIYQNLGRSYLAAGRLQEAAITFLQAQFLRETPQDTPEAIATYRLLDPVGCALVMNEGRAAINYGCPLVRQHTCAAFADLIQSFQTGHILGVAESAAKQAREKYGCRL